MIKPLYIAALHRPFNQQLKTSKWVCVFIASSKKNYSASQLIPEFYYQMIGVLYREYQKEIPTSFNGLPSDTAVNTIYDYVKESSKKKFLEELPGIIRSRTTSIEKQIYSTYKAASYYVNLAKDKFDLIDAKNILTSKGQELTNIRSGFFSISKKEAYFYFERLLETDFHLFITRCLFIRLEKKYSLKSSLDEQGEFIVEYLRIRHFKFTSASLSNYNVVRNWWVESLKILDINGNIRKSFFEIVKSNSNFLSMYEDLDSLFKKFEAENFKAKTTYLRRKDQFLALYRFKLKKNKSDQDFVNLHDIKNEMRISIENFQKFLSEFYEKEKGIRNIFFSNTVNSIDTRERFLVRNRPVIKIKIKEK